MTQVAATAHVFPSANDLFGPGVAGDGRNSYEKNLADRWLAFLFAQNCVISGGALPGSDADLTIQIPTGKAYLAGRFVEWQATNVTLPASTTSHLWVRVLRDGSTNASSVVIEHNTTGTDPAPADTTKLGTATTSGSAVTSTVDQRSFAFINQARLLKPSVGTPELIDSGVTTAKILDANVTYAKMAGSSVGTGQLRTATGSATGSIGNSPILFGFYVSADSGTTVARLAATSLGYGATSQNIDLHDYSFFPNAQSTGSNNYHVRWRYFTASDEPTIWIIPDATGDLLGVWIADDPIRITNTVYEEDPATGLVTPRTVTRVSPVPPIQVPGGPAAISVPLAMLVQTGLSQRDLDSADRHIERGGLNSANRLYRALQIMTRDDAPATWIMQQCTWRAGEFRKMSELERTEAINRRTIPITRMP